MKVGLHVADFTWEGGPSALRSNLTSPSTGVPLAVMTSRQFAVTMNGAEKNSNDRFTSVTTARRVGSESFLEKYHDGPIIT
jgi:hypothetical protein